MNSINVLMVFCMSSSDLHIKSRSNLTHVSLFVKFYPVKRMTAVVGTSDFRILPTNLKAKISSVNESLLQDCEKDIIWYRDNFFGKCTTTASLI